VVWAVVTTRTLSTFRRTDVIYHNPVHVTLTMVIASM
jgi:hypothetical protein